MSEPWLKDYLKDITNWIQMENAKPNLSSK